MQNATLNFGRQIVSCTDWLKNCHVISGRLCYGPWSVNCNLCSIAVWCL